MGLEVLVQMICESSGETGSSRGFGAIADAIFCEVDLNTGM